MGRILIIDNHGQLAAAVRSALVAGAERVRRAKTARRACTTGVPPALLFLRADPGRSAVEVVDRLRARWPSAPVVVVTPCPSPTEEVALRRQGILCYLAEPLSDHVIRQIVLAAAPDGYPLQETKPSTADPNPRTPNP